MTTYSTDELGLHMARKLSSGLRAAAKDLSAEQVMRLIKAHENILRFTAGLRARAGSDSEVMRWFIHSIGESLEVIKQSLDAWALAHPKGAWLQQPGMTATFRASLLALIDGTHTDNQVCAMYGLAAHHHMVGKKVERILSEAGGNDDIIAAHLQLPTAVMVDRAAGFKNRRAYLRSARHDPMLPNVAWKQMDVWASKRNTGSGGKWADTYTRLYESMTAKNEARAYSHIASQMLKDGVVDKSGTLATGRIFRVMVIRRAKRQTLRIFLRHCCRALTT